MELRLIPLAALVSVVTPVALADVIMPIRGVRSVELQVSIPGEDARDWDLVLEHTIGSLDSLRDGCGTGSSGNHPLRNPAIVSEVLTPVMPAGGLEAYVAAARGGLTAALGELHLRAVPDGEGGVRSDQSWFRLTARNREEPTEIIGCTVTELTRAPGMRAFVHCDRPEVRSRLWTPIFARDRGAVTSDLAGMLSIPPAPPTAEERRLYGWESIRAGLADCASVNDGTRGLPLPHPETGVRGMTGTTGPQASEGR